MSHPADDFNPLAPASRDLRKTIRVLRYGRLAFPPCWEPRPLGAGGSGPSRRTTRRRRTGKRALAHARHTPALTSDRTRRRLFRPARTCPGAPRGPRGARVELPTLSAVGRAAPAPPRDSGHPALPDPGRPRAPEPRQKPPCPDTRVRGARRGGGRAGGRGAGGGGARAAGWGRSCLAGERPGPAARGNRGGAEPGRLSASRRRPGASPAGPGTHLPVGATATCGRGASVRGGLGSVPPAAPSGRRKTAKRAAPCGLGVCALAAAEKHMPP